MISKLQKYIFDLLWQIEMNYFELYFHHSLLIHSNVPLFVSFIFKLQIPFVLLIWFKNISFVLNDLTG